LVLSAFPFPSLIHVLIATGGWIRTCLLPIGRRAHSLPQRHRCECPRDSRTLSPTSTPRGGPPPQRFRTWIHPSGASILPQPLQHCQISPLCCPQVSWSRSQSNKVMLPKAAANRLNSPSPSMAPTFTRSPGPACQAGFLSLQERQTKERTTSISTHMRWRSTPPPMLTTHLKENEVRQLGRQIPPPTTAICLHPYAGL